MEVYTNTETISYPINSNITNYHTLVSIKAPTTNLNNNLNNKITSKFIILVDISYSFKIDTVKQTLETIVKYMKNTDYLCIILYNNNVDVLLPLQQMNDDIKKNVINNIQNIKTNGSTDIGIALIKANDILNNSTHILGTSTVFLMTDDTYKSEEIYNELKGDYKIHSFGIGDECAVDFLKVMYENRDGNTYARNIRIMITTGDTFAEINKINTHFKVIEENGVYTITIPYIQEGDRIDILIDFKLYEIPAPYDDMMYCQILGTISICYNNMIGMCYHIGESILLNRSPNYNNKSKSLIYDVEVSKQINRYMTSDAIKEAKNIELEIDI